MAGLSAARKAAYGVLCASREREAYVRELMNSTNPPATVARLSPEDRAFALRLAVGVTATRGTLDEIVDRYAARPSRLDADVRDALRLGAYELLFLGKSSHVAVSQAVEVVKTRAKSAAGLVNAVLRRVSENGPAFMAESAAHRYGLPTWLVERVAADLGTQRAEEFGASCLEPAPLYVANLPTVLGDRDAPRAFLDAGMPVQPCGAIPGAWRVQDPSKLARCSLVEEGKAVVSDYGAQIVACLAAPAPADRMIEVGSGRGTKTLLLAGHTRRSGGAARVWALDAHAYKTHLAAARLEKAHVEGVCQLSGDARNLDAFPDLPPRFERVLIDAPCSGTGTLRRHPEIAWSLTEADVASCAALQLELLRSCAMRVAAGGVMTYATCSVLREENEDVVRAFLDGPEGADFKLAAPVDVVAGPLGRTACGEIAERTTDEGCMRTYPAPEQCDGHFCAQLVRR